MMTNRGVMLITGTSKGIGHFLSLHYLENGWTVVGCSRSPVNDIKGKYTHFSLDVADESKVKKMFSDIRRMHGRVDVLINNAGIASMNHVLLTPLSTLEKVLRTNVIATFLFSREAAKMMQSKKSGRIVNFATVATPLKLEGEAAYASSKAAVESLTAVMARELADFGITVNAVGPTPIETDLIKSVPKQKMDALIGRQAIRRFGEFRDVSNVIDFFISPKSDFITGQIVYLGGI